MEQDYYTFISCLDNIITLSHHSIYRRISALPRAQCALWSTGAPNVRDTFRLPTSRPRPSSIDTG
jgi:hypothetical protein